ncbi:MAG: exodeoxyribonuclease VII small subunit [Lachnospiraceae bacterium]|nr:exodeoxyribonuclease VII small subunit [Lachnospiraceae bacterium]
MQDEEKTLEESFDELDGLLEAMEEDGATIEQSFAHYERGMKLVQKMHEKLSALEGKVEQINAEGQFEEFADEH